MGVGVGVGSGGEQPLLNDNITGMVVGIGSLTVILLSVGAAAGVGAVVTHVGGYSYVSCVPGIILAALIAGRPPNRGRPSKEFIADVEALAPPRIVEVIDHGLAENPVNRFGSGRLLASALEAALAGEPQVAAPDGDQTDAVDWQDLISLLPHPDRDPSAPSAGNGHHPDGNGNGTVGRDELEELLEQRIAKERPDLIDRLERGRAVLPATVAKLRRALEQRYAKQFMAGQAPWVPGRA